MNIRELTTEDEFRSAYPVMHELRTHLDEDEYMSLAAEMRPRGYRLVAVEDDGLIVALAGIRSGVNFYYRHYLFVYDLITTEEGRSKGYGLALMRYLEELARIEGCDTIALSSGFHRPDAHRFYEGRVGMERRGFDFVKEL